MEGDALLRQVGGEAFERHQGGEAHHSNSGIVLPMIPR